MQVCGGVRKRYNPSPHLQRPMARLVAGRVPLHQQSTD